MLSKVILDNSFNENLRRIKLNLNVWLFDKDFNSFSRLILIFSLNLSMFSNFLSSFRNNS